MKFDMALTNTPMYSIGRSGQEYYEARKLWGCDFSANSWSLNLIIKKWTCFKVDRWVKTLQKILGIKIEKRLRMSEYQKILHWVAK